MVSKCFNPACSAQFRSLGEGALFRLEPDGPLQSSALEPEYFWLCTRCEATMTLRLGDDGVAEVVPGAPPHAHGVRRDMPLAFNRNKGVVSAAAIIQNEMRNHSTSPVASKALRLSFEVFMSDGDGAEERLEK